MVKHAKAVVGVLAIHGNVAEHKAVLAGLKTETIDVRTPADLERCTHLIIPGGESTVMARFIDREHLRAPIVERARDGSLAILGTCAGAILLAAKATGHRAPKPLGLMTMTVERNAYGAQADSFDDVVKVKGVGDVHCAFIRAPHITQTGKDVEILAKHGALPVVVRSGRIVATACHPEQRGETKLHEWFLSV